jgi:glutamine amidotransferase
MITIIDYGMGNLRSIQNKLERVKVQASISSNPHEIERAEKLILPGVGAFGKGMKNLEDSGLIDLLNKRIKEQHVPILGICLGMQLFCAKSEEGNVNGLGWINAEIKRFNFENLPDKLRIPHMGWNSIKIKSNHALLDGVPDGSRFYFVHSYHIDKEASQFTTATAHYGYDFPAIIHYDNIWGTQFHPEKSHQAGLQILKNFAEKI